MSTCPKTGKLIHATRKAALAHIADLYRHDKGNPDLGAYPCGNHWHVGHSVVHFKQRIAKALKPGRGRATTYARNRRTKP